MAPENMSRSDTIETTADHNMWPVIKDRVEELYIHQNRTLQEVMEMMMEEYGFKATFVLVSLAATSADHSSERMYKSRLDSWGLSKNASESDYLAVAVLLNLHNVANLPECDFFLKNKRKTPKEFRKRLKNENIVEANFLAKAIAKKIIIPSYVHCVTPHDLPEYSHSQVGESTRSADAALAIPATHRQHGIFDELESTRDDQQSALTSQLSTTAACSDSASGLSESWARVVDVTNTHEQNGKRLRWMQNTLDDATTECEEAETASMLFESLVEASGTMPSLCTAINSGAENSKAVDQLHPNPDLATASFAELMPDAFSAPPFNPDLGLTIARAYDPARLLSQMDLANEEQSVLRPESYDVGVAQYQNPKNNMATSEGPNKSDRTLPSVPIASMVPVPLINTASQLQLNIEGSESILNVMDRWQNEAAGLLAASIYAPTSGALGRTDALDYSLKQVAAFVRKMCLSNNSLLLLTIDTVMVFLVVYAEGSLPESILRAIYHAAIGTLGEDDPVCLVIEWMTTAAGGSLLARRIDSTALQNVCNRISQTYGNTHSHSIVAAYCLAFQLLLEGKPSEAEERLLRLHETAVEFLGPKALISLNTLATLSRAQTRQGKHEAALDSISRCLNRTPVGTPLGLNYPYRYELLYRKALICKQLGRTDNMLKYYCIVVEGRAAALGKTHASTQKAHKSLVEALQENDMWEDHKDLVHRLLNHPQVDISEEEGP